MTTKIKSGKTQAIRKLSPELDESFAWFLEHISPKQFSRALRDALVEITGAVEHAGTPGWLYELTDGLLNLFRALDIAEDEGKYDERDADDREG
jgi:hypothetical protein